MAESVCFEQLLADNEAKIEEMSHISTEIVRKYYDPIIGAEQNTYMLEMFQSVEGIKKQQEEGSRFFFVNEGDRHLGYFAFYPRGDALYLSKLYLYEGERGKGYGRQIMDFIIQQARAEGFAAIELNVNRHNPTMAVYEKLGFTIIREEKNDIGSGFFMDDYVYRLVI